MSDYEKTILRFLKFHGYVNRPMSFLEIAHHLNSCGLSLPSHKISLALNNLIRERYILENLGFYTTLSSQRGLGSMKPWIPDPSDRADKQVWNDRRTQDVLLDKKWKKFLSRSRVFQYLPFVEGVFGAGSMSLGNVHKGSDFDVLIVAKTDRIFTTRFVAMLVLGILGFRRAGIGHRGSVSDKICLNHFITEKSMRLDDYDNLYCHELYYNLVPVYGSRDTIDKFYEANDWVKRRLYLEDRRFKRGSSLIKNILELLLGNFGGNKLEKIFKKIQLKRIYKNLNKTIGYRSRLKFTDHELEFHPDTETTEKWISSI